LRLLAHGFHRLCRVDDGTVVSDTGDIQVGAAATLEFLDPLLALAGEHDLGGSVQDQHELRLGADPSDQRHGHAPPAVQHRRRQEDVIGEPVEQHDPSSGPLEPALGGPCEEPEHALCQPCAGKVP